MLTENEQQERLSDIVADGRFIVFTGAGVSTTLRLLSRPTDKLPSWPELLARLGTRFASKLSDDDNRTDFDKLRHGRATSDELIEAASILSPPRVSVAEMDAAIREEVEPVEGHSPTHTKIAQLQPRGIVTLNYDRGHESAMAERKEGGWKIIRSPRDEEALRKLVESRFEDRFLLKAHGSIDDRGQLVLDQASYREVLAKQPTYRAFLRHLLTEFHFVFVGFGMQDPDFGDCLRELSTAYGSTIRDHILITRRIVLPAPDEDLETPFAQAQEARAVLLRRRFGIHTLRVREYHQIPELLDRVLSLEGPALREIIRSCLARNDDVRRHGQRQLAGMSENGKRRAVSVFVRQCQDLLAKGRNLSVDQEFEFSELAYALGKISTLPEAKKTLLQIACETHHKEVLAHALIGLSPAVRDTDLDTLRIIEQKCKTGGLIDHLALRDPHGRLPIYAANLIALAQARADAPRTA